VANKAKMTSAGEMKSASMLTSAIMAAQHGERKRKCGVIAIGVAAKSMAK